MKYSKKCAQADAGDTGAPASAASRDEKPPRPLPATLSMVKQERVSQRETHLLAGYGRAGEEEGEVEQCGTVRAAEAAVEAESK